MSFEFHFKFLLYEFCVVNYLAWLSWYFNSRASKRSSKSSADGKKSRGLITTTLLEILRSFVTGNINTYRTYNYNENEMSIGVHSDRRLSKGLSRSATPSRSNSSWWGWVGSKRMARNQELLPVWCPSFMSLPYAWVMYCARRIRDDYLWAHNFIWCTACVYFSTEPIV